MEDIEVNETTLFCSTDGFSITRCGNWFLPNGSKIASIIIGNQMIGLNLTNSVALSTGMYHCEMMDRKTSLITSILVFTQ